MSERDTQKHDKTTAPAVPDAFAPKPAAAEPAHKGEVTGAGKWVFEHKQAFSKDNKLAWYGIRNVLSNIIGITGLILTIVPTRWGMGWVAQKAHAKGLNKVEGLFGHATLQNMVGVGVSFATFRSLYKMCQRSYDRVFGDPTSAEEASKAVADLPKNIWKDFKQITPVEYPATIAAAFALVGIRSAIAGGTPEAVDTVAKKVTAPNYLKDLMGCAFLAYPVFFEVTERLGRDWQIHRGYTDPKTNEHINKDKMTLGEFVTRQVPAVAAGIIPYIGLNSLAYMKQAENRLGTKDTHRQTTYNSTTSGRINAGKLKPDGYFDAVWKEKPYQLFWTYTLGRDLYYDIYDWATGKSNGPGKHAEAAPLPQPGGGVLANAAPAPKALVSAKRPHAEVTDAAPQGKVIAAIDPKTVKNPTPAASHVEMAQNATHEPQGARHAV